MSHEYCETVEDFIARRSRLAFLDVAAARLAVPRVSAALLHSASTQPAVCHNHGVEAARVLFALLCNTVHCLCCARVTACLARLPRGWKPVCDHSRNGKLRFQLCVLCRRAGMHAPWTQLDRVTIYTGCSL